MRVSNMIMKDLQWNIRKIFLELVVMRINQHKVEWDGPINVAMSVSTYDVFLYQLNLGAFVIIIIDHHFSPEKLFILIWISFYRNEIDHLFIFH